MGLKSYIVLPFYIDMSLTRPQLPSRPHLGRKQSLLALKWGKNEISPFLQPFQENSCCTKGCHFPRCEWVAVCCGLSHSGPQADAQGHDSPCLRTQTREEDKQPGAKGLVVTHS
ncbi:hypothetical protein GOODEAATRI_014791 [Goodea atripinnis]|uniref:Uncharacterized protein n=1 Tax=Goodea atripinnis TaxID=208336 RepID=A0ABV0MKT5_9TELE